MVQNNRRKSYRTFICSREAVKHTKKQNTPKGGSIIYISSVHHAISRPYYIPYAISKAGLEMMTKTMALELTIGNIRTNIFSPGAIDTNNNRELRVNKLELERSQADTYGKS
jgi:glucose 1-dehydrogenase